MSQMVAPPPRLKVWQPWRTPTATGSPSPAPPPAADDHHLQLQHLHQPLPRSPTASDEGRSKPSTTAQLYLLVPLSVSRTPPAAAAAPRRAEVAPPPEEESTAAAVPLDMTRRGRLQRPSEEPPHHQHLLRPSVITCARRPSPAARDVAGVGADDDPDIDEHFRRSLGNAYQHLFSGNNNNNGSRGKDPAAPTLSLQITGNSVDDHFAKALGDTWQRLQQRREESGDGDRQQWGRGDDHRATD